MALKAPGILVFTLSIVLALAVLFSRFFGATIPYLTGDTTQFYAMWGAYLVLLLGCIMRGLGRSRRRRRAGGCADLSRGFWCPGITAPLCASFRNGEAVRAAPAHPPS
jgi:hypothetical protein